MTSIFSILLLAHIIGIILFAGTTLIDWLVSKSFWSAIDKDPANARVVHGVALRFQVLMGLGMAIIILSGIGMMVATKGVLGQATWFKIKFALAIAAILNGVLFGKGLGRKLNKLLDAGSQPVQSALLSLRSRYSLFYTTQLILIAAIISLGVLKP